MHKLGKPIKQMSKINLNQLAQKLAKDLPYRKCHKCQNDEFFIIVKTKYISSLLAGTPEPLIHREVYDRCTVCNELFIIKEDMEVYLGQFAPRKEQEDD